MNISNKGLIEIMSLEGVCLSPYLDSVGVWTIGVGITKFDGKDPRSFGTISIDQAIEMFKDRIKAYVAPVQKIDKPLTQTQFDALVSFCFNCGPGNLSKLCANRSVNAIGSALMLYTKPPEVTGRRQKEQKLYQYGTYSSKGRVLVFPVSANHHPVYSKGYEVDVSKYFGEAPTPTPLPVNPPHDAPTPSTAPPEGLSLRGIWEWLKAH